VTRTEYNATISVPVRKYLTFVNSPPRSYFKKLFIGTDLGKAPWTMSEDKALPTGLKDEEVERGKIRRPPIPYIPPEYPIQESVERQKASRSRYQMEQLFTIRSTMVALMKLSSSM
jgi:hypothetical protein